MWSPTGENEDPASIDKAAFRGPRSALCRAPNEVVWMCLGDVHKILLTSVSRISLPFCSIVPMENHIYLLITRGTMGADTPEIMVGTAEGGLYLNPLGRATQRTCPTADQLTNEFLASCPQSPIVVIDLAGCEWLDSTFAGWLVGLQRRMSRIPGGSVTLCHCGDRCKGSLERMKLTGLFNFENVEVPTETQPIPCTTSDQPSKEELKLMLAAHETLAGVSAENEQIFTPIAATLRHQIEKG